MYLMMVMVLLLVGMVVEMVMTKTHFGDDSFSHLHCVTVCKHSIKIECITSLIHSYLEEDIFEEIMVL